MNLPFQLAMHLSKLDLKDGNSIIESPGHLPTAIREGDIFEISSPDNSIILNPLWVVFFFFIDVARIFPSTPPHRKILRLKMCHATIVYLG